MADSRLPALSEISLPVVTDELYIVDVSDATDHASGTSRKITAGRAGGLLSAYPAQGRLTLTSGTPFTTADVTGATSVYWTPCNGDLIALYDATRWAVYQFTELTLALGTLVNAQAYDVFCYNNAGTLTLETAEWANATVTMTIASPCVVTWTGHGMATGNSITFTTTGALPTGVTANTQYWITVVDANTFKLSTSLANVAAGTFINTSGSQSGTHTGHQPQARATALTTQNGVYCKSGALTRRYLGTFFTSSTTTTEDSGVFGHQSGGKRFLWNMYNRVRKPFGVIDTTNSWTYQTATWRQAGAVAGNKVECILGLALDPVCAIAKGNSSNSGGQIQGTGIGIDSTSANSAQCIDASSAIYAIPKNSIYEGFPSIGYHAFHWLEISTASGTTTWYGDFNVTYLQSGLTAWGWF